MSVYLCKYLKKGLPCGFELIFAAAFSYIMLSHAQDKLSIRSTDFLKIELINEVHDEEF